MGRNRSVSKVKSGNLPSGKVEQKEAKLRSVVVDRTTRGVVLANPYSKPRPIIQ